MIKNENIEELFELVLVDEEDGVFANSLVAAGAIERDFVYFNQEYTFAAVNDEKMLIAGPMLIPNKKILRLKEDGTPYHVFFTPQTIEKVARKFMKNKLLSEVTLEHGNKTSGVHMVESWIVEHPTKDKSNLYGFTLPKGSWFAVYSAEDNPKVWERVKSGEFNGFSIEGLFEHQRSDVKLALEKDIEELTEIEAEVLLGQIKALIKKDKRYKAKQRIEMESFQDYGSGVRGNAKRGRELNEKNGNKCATQVGKVRSAQLEAGEAISLETIKRMYSYLSRAEAYYDETDMNACGTISFLLWGGKAGLAWSRNKLRELGELVEGKEGVPHYTKDGKLYEGPTHKGPDGRLMTGIEHTADSKPLYHIEELEAQPSISSSYPGQSSTQRKKKDDK